MFCNLLQYQITGKITSTRGYILCDHVAVQGYTNTKTKTLKLKQNYK